MYGIVIFDNPSKYCLLTIERVNVFAQEMSTCRNMGHMSLGHQYLLIEIRKICILTKNDKQLYRILINSLLAYTA